MRRFFALATTMVFGAGLAMADLTGNGSGLGGGPDDPFLFGGSGAAAIDLFVVDANHNGYMFTTDFDEINAGVFNQGWWSATATNIDSNADYFVGIGPTITANDYFTFNMAQFQISAPIVSAMLAFQTTGTFSMGLPVTFEVGSVTDSATTLANKSAGPDAAIFADLATANYGSVFVANATAYSNPLKLMLNSAAVTDLNAAINSRDFFSIGGTLSVDPVAEPLSLVLLGTVMIVFMRLLRRKVQA
jgi:hypothetical protein